MISNRILFNKLARFPGSKILCSSSFLANVTPQRNYMHIKNMEKEKQRAEIQRDYDKQSNIEEYTKVYKPSHTIEFNRVGEVLLYSCDPFKHREIYMKYPYVLFESLVPLHLFMFAANPFHLSWGMCYYFLFAAIGSFFPRAYYLNSMQYRIRRMWLLRGGRVIKFERSTLAGDQYTNWVEVRHFKPLTEDFKEFEDDEADFLTEEGQLKYELGTELEQFRQWGVNDQDVNVFFLKEGIVHQPELFEAVVKGYHVDTTDFVINTLLAERTREPHHNY